MKRATRGFGLMENFLAGLRSRKADELIPDSLRSGRLLDIGCGTFPVFLLSVDFREKCGLDKVDSGETRTALLNKGIKFTSFDFERQERLPFSDNYFEAVTMLAVIEHIDPSRLIEMMSEVRRILKPNGLLIITTPATWARSLLLLLAAFSLISRVEISEHKDVYNHAMIRDILRQAGFQEQKMKFGFFESFMNNWITARK